MEMKADDLKKVVEPKNTALVVWDVQKILVNNIFNKEEFVQKLKAIIDAARKAGVPIFFTKITPLPERFESQARKMSFRVDSLMLRRRF